jgi:hypothetical protein
MNKLEFLKLNTQSQINFYEELVSKTMEEIKDCVNRNRVHDMVTFLPSKCEQLKEYTLTLKLLKDKMNALNFLEKENN